MNLEDKNMILTRDQIIETLKNSNCTVKFTKINGEVREMPCTLREDIIPKPPADIASKSNVKRHENLGVISVWCLDKQAWRSFRVDSIQELRVD